MMSFRWNERVSSVPLTSLSAAILDTETTGLNTSADRVVQFGAVRIVDGHIDESAVFDRLVNPGIPIPPRATQIHGITDEDVAGAKGFEDIFPEFAAWAEDSLMLGFSFGFDLGILQSEHDRLNLRWSPPRSLDVRHLLQLLTPNSLPVSLDAAAEQLGIPVTDRHNAVGDAVLTAKIYLAIAPQLRDRGIVTLAQAEQACLGLLARHQMEGRAGWHEVVTERSAIPNSLGAYARIDSYPYRHRVRDVMHAPPVIVNADADVTSVNRQMLREKVSSVFVRPTGEGNADGIVTERDLLRALDTSPDRLETLSVSSIAGRPLITVDQDELLYRAMNQMASANIRHLGVTDGSGKLVGALSSRNLLYQRAEDAVSLGESVDKARSAQELGQVWADLTVVVGGLLDEGIDGRDIAAVISRELGELTRRSCELAEREMADRGLGDPPAAYALMVLGSGGRGESLLAMDQDNAIVFADTEDNEEASRWFLALGEIIADTLNAVGVSYCSGGVMAKNADWCMSRVRWREKVASWLGSTRPEHILNADIFFDGLPVYGDVRLGDQIRQEGIDTARRASGVLNLMSMNAANFQVPVGMFGRLRRINGRVDLKAGGILPIFSTARVLALKYGKSERSTPGRLEAIRDQMGEGHHLISNLIEAHRIFLDLVLKQQIRDIELGIKQSNKVDPAQLSSHQTQELKWAFDQVRGIPDLVGIPKGLW